MTAPRKPVPPNEQAPHHPMNSEIDIQLVGYLRGVDPEEADVSDERGNWPVLACLDDGRVVLIETNVN